MEKKKSNPFHVLLILLTLIIGGGLFGFGYMKKSEFDKSKQQFDSASASLKSMEEIAGYPSQETVDKKTNSLIAYKGKIEGLRNSLKSSAISEFKNIPSGKFARELGKANDEIKKLYKGKEISLPTNWHMGFEKYTTVPAPKNATGELNYQLQALTWLHQTLAEYNPSALTNLYRKPIASESASDGDEKTIKSQHVALPIELTFVAYEEDAREFLNALVKANKYFFTIDTAKIKLLPAEVEEIVEEEKEEEMNEDAFENIFEIDEEEEADEQPVEEVVDTTSNEKLFNQELGQERVAVFLDLNLVYLTSQEPLPEIAKSNK